MKGVPRLILLGLGVFFYTKYPLSPPAATQLVGLGVSTLSKASVGNWVHPFSWGTQYLVIVIFLCWNIVDSLFCVTTILMSTP